MTTRMFRAGVLGFVVSVVWTGCDGRTFIGSPGGGSGGSNGLSGAGGVGNVQATVDASASDATAGSPDGPPPYLCTTLGQANTPTTVAAMRTALSRDWLLCSPLGLFDRPQVGVRITADDHWALLVRDATGNVVPSSSADATGTVQYEDTSNISTGPFRIQVGFTSDAGAGTVISFPSVTQYPTVLIINNEGVEEYRYNTPDGA